MSKSYPLGLVGESNYQVAIRRCSIGERLYVSEEANNPYDSGAIAVEREGGAVVGYIPKDSWLREIVHQGRSTRLTIKSIQDGGGGFLGVVVDVIADAGSSPRFRDYREAKSKQANSKTEKKASATGKSIGAGLMKALFGKR